MIQSVKNKGGFANNNKAYKFNHKKTSEFNIKKSKNSDPNTILNNDNIAKSGDKITNQFAKVKNVAFATFTIINCGCN